MPTPDGPSHDLVHLLEVLDRHGVEYLLVGGAAAIAYGAERLTDDADCVVRRGRDNLERLARALRELRARLRVAGLSDAEARSLPFQLDADALERTRVTTWMTDAGPFDVLAGLEALDGRLIPYEELVGRSTVLRGEGFVVRAAALEDIIRAKERANRDKDRYALPELRASVIAPTTPTESPVLQSTNDGVWVGAGSSLATGSSRCPRTPPRSSTPCRAIALNPPGTNHGDPR